MGAESVDLSKALREAGLRVTQQRVVVLSILMDSQDHPNADEVFTRAKEIDGSVSFATVYRSLSALEEAGLVRKLSFENEPARFETMPVSDHDHLVDVETGEVIEIDSDEINRLRQEIVARLGYEIVSQHTVIRARRKPR
ncbi:Fur family transcriptional regulator [Mesobacterium pallidum]|uniref:Fur family transcriptional regulator n=1 Tax=Mesobacterium pallidum TaxID=2872037 RepID=UPI001EE26331|nr:Fur family transcriptional regulator [Mesobacterium pallidum]